MTAWHPSPEQRWRRRLARRQLLAVCPERSGSMPSRSTCSMTGTPPMSG